jgi:hypothetical protein
MATILLIEDGPGIGCQLPSLLATAGHRVLWCGGGPTPLAACPLLRHGHCPLAAAAELLVFACPLDLPLRGRSYRGRHLLAAYRSHPDYGRLPLVLVAIAPPPDLAGTGPTELITTFEDPAAIVAATNRLLPPADTAARPPKASARNPVNRAIADSARYAVSAAVPATAERVRRAGDPRPPTGSPAAHHTRARLRRWRSCSCTPDS